ncbi:hypothetical protein K2Z83_09440 [Oscillochloris sp. ZM17-4]|uniref:COG1470 family protein n=1 Tax=Oscillochloris sp. ZM17-4 TaxID=2866714 RepID=UPI001C73636C|nr:NEW3 domain-containing protein [Oscillochloris sp. ZM17-4]MBX0327896.1 hypothetical protein [Oscillochloris sp. ZM17-4]
MRRLLSLLAVGCLGLLVGAPAAFAQGATTPPPVQGLTLFTRFPSEEVALGDAISFPLVLRADSAQIAQLSLRDLPKGWTATLRGNGKIIQSAYVNPGEDASVDLRLDPPKDVASGTFKMSVVASGASEVALPLSVMIEQKLPPSLEFSADLPTIRNAPGSTFTFNTTLKNAGDTDLTVNLVAQAPNGFDVKFSTAGQDVTSLPITANSSKNITVAVSTPSDAQAGSVPIQVKAEGGDISADIALTAEVVGTSKVNLTTPDGRLSGDAYIGASTPFTLEVRNTGSAPAKGITVSASPPAGWKVDFSPAQIDSIPPGDQVEVTASVHPADQAVAGDYVIGFSARPAEGSTSSADFRVTVLTSTLWGIVGIGLIAVAVAVVGLAVMRFGRR